MVNKRRLLVLIYPGKPLVSLGYCGNGKEAMFVLIKPYMVLKKPFITVVSLKHVIRRSID